MRREILPPASEPADDEARARAAATAFDSAFHAHAAPLTAGLSPISLSLAFADWAMHLATQPAQSMRLAMAAQRGAYDWWANSLTQQGNGVADGEDLRFSHPAWHQWPYAPVVRAYRGAEAWWRDATSLRGMSPHHQEMARVFARQWLDTLSPANAGLANPEVMQRTLERQGGNLVDGLSNAMNEWRARQGLKPVEPPERPFQPGVDVAITPGQVVHRNALVELIQYEPTTKHVQAEPVFIVPSWINKYYILDLSPHNSMVRWLVSQGHTVFIVSWRNPDEGDALLTMEDYLHLGVFDSLAVIAQRVPGEAVHACGYCLGGTLLSVGAAALARTERIAHAELLPALASLTLLAAETDFSEPGEMGVLIDESQVSMLEDMMAERGFLTGPQMGGSFQFLHSRELVWSAKLRELWLGERLRPSDLTAWNTDVTRMPAAMHSEYLRRCYLRNEIAEARYPVEGKPVALSDIRQPMFVVGTEKDHVSPWKSVYKLHHLTDTALTFVLTNGGHNAGIVSEPGHHNRHYAQHTRRSGDTWIDPATWQQKAHRHEGSWWPAWHAWLLAHGSHRQVPARAVDQGLYAAPGQHVMQRYHD
ncbi:MAG: polyhydroxyalkanoic acid synthase [Burkholderiales bacterium]|nr:polyhydroxyalkanoic acid synthase [Burkholderiales bacterium]